MLNSNISIGAEYKQIEYIAYHSGIKISIKCVDDAGQLGVLWLVVLIREKYPWLSTREFVSEFSQA